MMVDDEGFFLTGDSQQDPSDTLELSLTLIYAPEWDNRIQRVGGRR